eukprot:4188474-Prymnesium_polylepis.1
MMHTCTHPLARGYVPACPDGAPRLPACRTVDRPAGQHRAGPGSPRSQIDASAPLHTHAATEAWR